MVCKERRYRSIRESGSGVFFTVYLSLAIVNIFFEGYRLHILISAWSGTVARVPSTAFGQLAKSLAQSSFGNERRNE